MLHMALCPLTVVFKSVSMHLRLKGAKSDFTSVAQDPALSVTDLNSVDLPSTHIRGPPDIVQSSTYEGSICRKILDHDGVWILSVPPDDTMLVA